MMRNRGDEISRQALMGAGVSSNNIRMGGYSSNVAGMQPAGYKPKVPEG